MANVSNVDASSENTTHSHVYSNNPKFSESEGVPPLGPLRPISKQEQETHDEKSKVKVVEDKAGNVQIWHITLHCIWKDNKYDVILSLSTDSLIKPRSAEKINQVHTSENHANMRLYTW